MNAGTHLKGCALQFAGRAPAEPAPLPVLAEGSTRCLRSRRQAAYFFLMAFFGDGEAVSAEPVDARFISRKTRTARVVAWGRL